jgi:DNA recombination protein RmuC
VPALTEAELLIVVAAQSAAVLLLLLWLLLALRRQARTGAERQTAQLAEQHRLMLGELHGALSQQGDRVMLQGTAQAERLREGVSAELQRTQGAMQRLQLSLAEALGGQREDAGRRLAALSAGLQAEQDRLRRDLLGETMKSLSEHARADRELLQKAIGESAAQLGGSMEALLRAVHAGLERIGGQVNERLDAGFARTNETFANVMARLATIDEAQRKIEGLASDVVGLQELLGDKKARGAFGEVQLEALVRNVLPPGSFAFQHTLPNGTRADCVLMLPEPTGMVAVDAKFPLENYHRMLDAQRSEPERRQAQTAFRGDVKRHVDAIAAKYIVANVTADGAVMFVPAEAVFAEIHAYHAEVVAHALAKRVWIVSPTTLMAVLNTARAVLKDVETRRQIHLIKDALAKLAKDFARFDERMANLARHIEQANKDVQDVHSSSRKISGQFLRIEQVQLADATAPAAVGHGLRD